jgi:hypothetical protein
VTSAWPDPPTYEEALAFLPGLVGSDVTISIGAQRGRGVRCVVELRGVLSRAEQHTYVDELDPSYQGTEVLEFEVGHGGRFVVAERDFAGSEWVTRSRSVLGDDVDGPARRRVKAHQPCLAFLDSQKRGDRLKPWAVTGLLALDDAAGKRQDLGDPWTQAARRLGCRGGGGRD